MTDIRTKPATPEYEEAYDRVFNKKPIAYIVEDDKSDIKDAICMIYEK